MYIVIPHTGHVVEVLEWVEAKGRWTVRCKDGEVLAVQPKSLCAAPQGQKAAAAAAQKVIHLKGLKSNRNDAIDTSTL